LPNESGTARANSEPDPDFFPPLGGAREEEVGQIHAREEEDERAHHREQAGESEDRISNVGNEKSGRHQKHTAPCVFLRMLFRQLRGDSIELRFRLCARDAGLEAPDDEEIVAVARIEPGAARLDLFRHHHRHPEFRRIRDLGADETRRRDPDDGKGMSVEQDCLPDDGRIAVESFLPAGVAHNHDWLRARRPILFRPETAPERRFYSENVEVISRDIVTPDALVNAIVAETGDDEAISEQTGEDRVAISVVLVVGIRLESEIRAVAQLAVHRDELRRLAQGQRSQEDGIDETEDGGVGANPKRHRRDGERGEARMLPQLAPAVTDVLQERSHLS